MEDVGWLLEREAGRVVRKWKEWSEENAGGKRAETFRRSTEEVERLQKDAPLREAWERIEERR